MEINKDQGSACENRLRRGEETKKTEQLSSAGPLWCPSFFGDTLRHLGFPETSKQLGVRSLLETSHGHQGLCQHICLRLKVGNVGVRIEGNTILEGPVYPNK